MKLIYILALVVSALFPLGAVYAAISIDTVPVGDVGNPGDAQRQGFFGSVNYAYRIGKYEVTVGQYAAFLNAVAATDTYGLYSPYLGSDATIAGIAQSCSPNCTYSVIGSPNHPVTYVSWGDAARFANWLHNGQPMGAEDATTTEDGAYTLKGATSAMALSAISRNPGASWFIPSEDEWYKAAYYQPAAAGGDSDGYWAYPMKTNSVPYSDQPPGATPDNTRVGNFNYGDGLANGYNDGLAVTGSSTFNSSQNYLTDVGAYSSSPSYYGTFDQGGNVWEWNELLVTSGYRGTRGGSWDRDPSYMTAITRIGMYSAGIFSTVGFRVATITPEPSTIAIVSFAAVAGFGGLRRRR